ncbi:MAG: hypothetical protein IPL22_21515 [Bacteroidetes bacterium]|nr:hypothetical protein [Bacteroidota bacterium]
MTHQGYLLSIQDLHKQAQVRACSNTRSNASDSPITGLVAAGRGFVTNTILWD